MGSHRVGVTSYVPAEIIPIFLSSNRSNTVRKT